MVLGNDFSLTRSSISLSGVLVTSWRVYFSGMFFFQTLIVIELAWLPLNHKIRVIAVRYRSNI